MAAKALAYDMAVFPLVEALRLRMAVVLLFLGAAHLFMEAVSPFMAAGLSVLFWAIRTCGATTRGSTSTSAPITA
eukprot:904161-Rhodomonas_salina.1